MDERLHLRIRSAGPSLMVLLGWLLSLSGCTGFSHPLPPPCKVTSASETRAIAIENTGQENLKDYAVAVPLDETNFDFTVPSSSGSGLEVTDPATNGAIPFWIESYDPTARKALLWVKLSELNSQTSRSVLLASTNCPGSLASGSDVFPFFADGNNVDSWQAANQLSVTNTITQGPLTISDRMVIESDGNYNGFPGVARASNGDFVLTYKKGGSHIGSHLVVLRRSSDQGKSWSPEVIYFDSSQPDPGLLRTPGGDLLIALEKADPAGTQGAAYSRSTDNGLTWVPFTFFDSPVSASLIVNPLFNLGPTIYGAGFGPFADATGDASSVWSSADDGLTWDKLSVLRQPGEAGFNEIALAQTGPNELFAVMRSDNALETFGRYSSDLGLTWGP